MAAFFIHLHSFTIIASMVYLIQDGNSFTHSRKCLGKDVVYMKIFVTDEGRFWNHNNPVLESFTDHVVVVCLNGYKVTDKYACIVSPYRPVGMGNLSLGKETDKYLALQSVRDKFREVVAGHEDLVFLTDAEPTSLYPYCLLKEENVRLHLWCMTPWSFESQKRRKSVYGTLRDLEHLSSLHYVDSDEFLQTFDKGTSMSVVLKAYQKWLNEMLPNALYEIGNSFVPGKRYLYDLDTKQYVLINGAYVSLFQENPRQKENRENETDIKPPMLGRMVANRPESISLPTKTVVEMQHSRVDGKRICEKMKEFRVRLARANGIPYESIDCPSTGPCAGTCNQCDRELQYLNDELQKIPEEKRIYPFMDCGEQILNIQADHSILSRGTRGVIPSPSKDAVVTGEIEIRIPDFLVRNSKQPKQDGETDE